MTFHNATGRWLVSQQDLRKNPLAGLPAASTVALGATYHALTHAH